MMDLLGRVVGKEGLQAAESANVVHAASCIQAYSVDLEELMVAAAREDA